MFTSSLRAATATATAVAVTALLIATPVFADIDPLGCSSTGGAIGITAYRFDGTTPIGGGTVTDGESIKYKATLFAIADPTFCAFQGGTWTLVTPVRRRAPRSQPQTKQMLCMNQR